MFSQQNAETVAEREAQVVALWVFPGPLLLLCAIGAASAGLLGPLTGAAWLFIKIGGMAWCAAHVTRWFILHPDKLGIFLAHMIRFALDSGAWLGARGAPLWREALAWLAARRGEWLAPAAAATEPQAPVSDVRPVMSAQPVFAPVPSRWRFLNWRMIGLVALAVAAIFLFGALRSCIENGPFDAITTSKDELVEQRNDARDEARTAVAEKNLQSELNNRADARHTEDARIDNEMEQVREAIRDAPDLEARFAAYRNFTDRMRDGAGFAAALSNYAVSVIPDAA